MGGRIGMHSMERQGRGFWFELPPEETTLALQHDTPATGPAGSQASSVLPILTAGRFPSQARIGGRG
jgi:hypothetical protein